MVWFCMLLHGIYIHIDKWQRQLQSVLNYSYHWCYKEKLLMLHVIWPQVKAAQFCSYRRLADWGSIFQSLIHNWKQDEKFGGWAETRIRTVLNISTCFAMSQLLLLPLPKNANWANYSETRDSGRPADLSDVSCVDGLQRREELSSPFIYLCLPSP